MINYKLTTETKIKFYLRYYNYNDNDYYLYYNNLVFLTFKKFIINNEIEGVLNNKRHVPIKFIKFDRYYSIKLFNTLYKLIKQSILLRGL
jgi:hypothetical protein